MISPDNNNINLSLDDSNTTINARIFRHAFSCANLAKETGDSRKQFDEKDPGLTIWGIISTLIQSNKTDNGFNNDIKPVVFVSPLIRTWMTAIVLFGPQVKNGGELTLVLSPGISEQSGDIGYIRSALDNTREDFNKQLKRIKLFIRVLIRIQEIIDSYEDNFNDDKPLVLLKNNVDNVLKLANIKIYNSDGKCETIYVKNITEETGILYNKENDLLETQLLYEIKNDMAETNNIINNKNNVWLGIGSGENIYIKRQIHEIISQFKLQHTHQTESINKEVDNQIPNATKDQCKLDILNKINTDTNKPYSANFNNDNIDVFFSWLKDVLSEYENQVYVVSHSHVLQDLVKKILIKEPQDTRENVEVESPATQYMINYDSTTKIKEYNTWSLQLQYIDTKSNTGSNIKIIKMYRGMPKPSSMSTQTSKCEPVCVFGQRTSKEGTEERMRQCINVVNQSQKKLPTSSLLAPGPARTSLKKPSGILRRFGRLFTPGSQYKPNGGKNKTRRRRKNKTKKRRNIHP